MGLRFRRSISLGKGLRLNFGKTGMSISGGVKGFRKTYNLNTGKTTTTVGLPGTGVYYTTTSGGKKEKEQPNTSIFGSSRYKDAVPQTTYMQDEPKFNQPIYEEAKAKDFPAEHTVATPTIQSNKKLTYEDIQSVCRVCDEKIDWFEILSSKKPTDNFFNENMWDYLHNVALSVCKGDIDAYLQVIQDINPYDDLLDYAENFEFGTDDEKEMTVSFRPLSNIVDESDKELYEDFVAACIIRIARDTFALLPVETVNVIAEFSNGNTLSASFKEKEIAKIKFSYSDPSTIVSAFKR